MSIILNGTTGITAPAIDATLDAADLTGDVAASQITTALNATGSAPIYACRAWVNFNGTGTVAIRGSGNVSSITDNGTGDYTVNFTTAMPDTNYAAVFGGGADTTARNNVVMESHVASTSNFRFLICNVDATVVDRPVLAISIFR